MCLIVCVTFFNIVDAIRSVCISLDSKYFASASVDKTIRVYTTRDAQLMNILYGKYMTILVR